MSDSWVVQNLNNALKLFIRFAIAKGVVTYGLELMLALFTIAQGIMSIMMKASGVAKAGKATLPAEIERITWKAARTDQNNAADCQRCCYINCHQGRNCRVLPGIDTVLLIGLSSWAYPAFVRRLWRNRSVQGRDKPPAERVLICLFHAI